MILQIELIPFYLILRSRSKDKGRYLTSVKHYYGGKPNTYLAFVCKVFIEEVKSLNSRLEMAGLEQIKPIPLDDEDLANLEKALKDYQTDSRKF